MTGNTEYSYLRNIHANKQVKIKKRSTHINKWQKMLSFPPYVSKSYPMSPLKPSQRLHCTTECRENSCAQHHPALTICMSTSQSLLYGLSGQIITASYLLSTQNPQRKNSILAILSSSAILLSFPFGIQGRKFKWFSDPRYNMVWEKLISLNNTIVTDITHLNNF